ncbi:hypothetical protein [Streptomyces sp. NPDC007117]|uniref:hypothetical protein n=1 Tax=Streptomyces sp. NPDC007117 TaxID=3154314 RepID=UPI0033FD4929
MNKIRSFLGQAAQFSALRHLAEKYGDLPGGYVTCSNVQGEISFFLDSLTDFEAWREALNVPASGVALHSSPTQRSLRILLPVGDAVVRIWAVIEPVPAEEAA